MKLTLTETGQKHMAITNSSSNKLKNLELSIQLSLSGLSFCILNKDSNTILEVKELRFEKRLNPFELLDELKALFENESTLNKSFTNVTIVHNNDLSTLVPEALFNKNSAADYLKFNSKILKSDFIAYDNILENSSINVYVPYININNYIYDKFGTFIFKHISSVLIESILEHSGGAESLATFLLSKFGEKRSSWALMLTGFIVAIPVFFDVAFIILVPMIYALQRKTGKSLLLYGIPLLAGLAITHSFIPPTPGPVAVADIVKADLGWVIFFGFLTGIPTAIVCGPLFAKYIAKKIHVDAPVLQIDSDIIKTFPPVGIIISIISIPIVLIVLNTLLNSPLIGEEFVSKNILEWLGMIGHPFSALIIANLIAWYTLGLCRGFTKDKLLNITTQSMGPAGIIILLTGAGGVFKQMLVNTGAGEMLANYFADQGVSILLFSFIAAALIRILQGSATVAMITAAGL
ncbi:SLC13 family permease, partial [bacterium]|nr:SLC13 family permease [bacterium]